MNCPISSLLAQLGALWPRGWTAHRLHHWHIPQKAREPQGQTRHLTRGTRGIWSKNIPLCENIQQYLYSWVLWKEFKLLHFLAFLKLFSNWNPVLIMTDSHQCWWRFPQFSVLTIEYINFFFFNKMKLFQPETNKTASIPASNHWWAENHAQKLFSLRQRGIWTWDL